MWVKNIRKFGLTVSEYETMLRTQNDCCAICKKAESKRRRDGSLQKLSIDHDHSTGQVRQLLCNYCNLLISYAREDISVLSQAIAYVSRWKPQPTGIGNVNRVSA